MKNKLFLLLLITACNTITVCAQNNIPEKKVTDPGNVAPKIFKVLGVKLSVHGVSHMTNTTRDVEIYETFTYIGSGTVTYTYHDSIPSSSGSVNLSSSTHTRTVTLNGTGTTEFLFSHTCAPMPYIVKIITDTPNKVTSNTVGF